MTRARDLANIGADATGLATDAELASGLASKLDITGGKILQVVRATDGTQRSTTSTSFVDISGMSVTITPQKSDSAIVVIVTVAIRNTRTGVGNTPSFMRITDASANALSGASGAEFRADDVDTVRSPLTLIGYSTPATTSATTYKVQFKSGAAGVTVFAENAISVGQLYAIEVSA